MIKTNKDLKREYKIKTDNKMRGAYGDTDLGKKVIRINRKASKKHSKKTGRAEVLDTIMHEAMHAKHPKMHEYTVRRKVKKTMANLSKLQKNRYYAMGRGC